MRLSALRIVLAFLLLLSGGPIAAVAGSAAAPGTDRVPTTAIQQPPVAAVDTAVDSAVSPHPQQIAEIDARSRTVFEIDLQSNRDARWTVSVKYVLTDGNETAAFERIAGRFESGDIGPSAALYQNLAAGASEAAGREMTITSIDRETALDRDVDPDALDTIGSVDGLEDGETVAVGELRLTFTWTAFLRTDGDQLVLDDAFRTSDGGTWIRSLDATQRMVIHPPDGYQADSFPGIGLSLEDRAVVIEGPRTFGPDDHIEVVYSPAPGAISGPPWLLLASAIVLAAVVIAIGLVRYRRHEEAGSEPAADSDRSSGSESETRTSEEEATDDADATSTAIGSGAASDTASSAGSDTDTATAGDSAETDDVGTSEASTATDVSPNDAGTETDDEAQADEETEADNQAQIDEETATDDGSEQVDDDETQADEEDTSTPDPSLLSDEERVEALLDRNGGRMRQADIVSETGWSDAKVSQLLSAMAEADRIEKLRLGRENLISLPDHTPDDIEDD